MGAGSSEPLPAGSTHGVRVMVKERYHAYLPPGTNLNAVLNEEKVKLVHDHWQSIAEEREGPKESRSPGEQSRISIFYDAFYDKLFQDAPKTRNLFQGNMVRQSRALVKMVSWLCNLEVTEDLVSRLEALADKHVAFGCLPSHYYSGSIALQHALRVTAEDDDVPLKVMEAWNDLYSFVMLIVIPRTALLLEEAVRTAGPVSAMLRSTPISGTRVRRLKTPPPGRSNSSTLSTSAPHTVDGELLGEASRRAEGAARVAPIVRSESGSFTRKKTTSRRSISWHKGKVLEEVDGGVVGLLVGGSNASSGGRGWTLFTDKTAGLSPGDSPASATSSRHVSVSDSAHSAAGYDSICPSPNGSTSSAARRRRKSKVLMGLGKLTGGGGGDRNERRSPRGAPSIRARARNAVVRSSRTDFDDGAGTAADGRGIGGGGRHKAGAAALHLPFGVRHRHLRSGGTAMEPSTDSLTVAKAERESSVYTSSSVCASSSGRNFGSVRSSGGSEYGLSVTRRSFGGIRRFGGSERCLDGSGHSNGGHAKAKDLRSARAGGCSRGGGDAADSHNPLTLASPARSTVSLPSVPSSEQSLQLSTSRRIREQTTVAPTSESTSAVFLGSPDFKCSGVGTDDVEQSSADGRQPSIDVRETSLDVGDGGVGGIRHRTLRTELGEGEGVGSDKSRPGGRASAKMSPPRDTRTSVGGLTSRLPGMLPATPVATPVGIDPPSPALKTGTRTTLLSTPATKAGRNGLGQQSAPEPFQLPASSTARMESLSLVRKGGVGHTAGAIRVSGGMGGAVHDERAAERRRPGVLEKDDVPPRRGIRLSPRQEAIVSPSSGCPMAVGTVGIPQAKLQSAAMANEQLQTLVIPRTPGTDDDARRARRQMAPSPSPGARRGSRRGSKRISAGSSSRNQFAHAKSDRDSTGESKRRSDRPVDSKTNLPSSGRLSRKEAAEAAYGFLPTGNDPFNAAQRQQMWRTRKCSSSGAEIDQLEAHALAYWEKKEREMKLELNHRPPFPGEAQTLLLQQRHRDGFRAWVHSPHLATDEEKMGEPVPLTLPPAIAAAATRQSNNTVAKTHQDSQYSPTPEELVAAEAEEHDARSAAASAGEHPSQPHTQGTTSAPRIRQPPTTSPACSPAPGSPTPCIGKAINRQPNAGENTPGGRRVVGGGGDRDGGSVIGVGGGGAPATTVEQSSHSRDAPSQGQHTRRGEQTPPMWVSRRTIMARASTPTSSPRQVAKDSTGGIDGVRSKCNNPPASPPLNQESSTPAANRTKEPTRQSTSFEAKGKLTSLQQEAQGSTVVDRAEDVEKRASVIAEAGAITVQKDVSVVIEAKAALTRVAAARSTVVGMASPGDNFATSITQRLSKGNQPPALRDAANRSFGHFKQQLPLQHQPQPGVEWSANRPMSLPPADGDDGQCPEPDVVGGGTTAGGAAALDTEEVGSRGGHTPREKLMTNVTRAGNIVSLSATALAAAANERRARLHALHSPRTDDEMPGRTERGVLNQQERRRELTESGDSWRALLVNGDAVGRSSVGTGWALPARGRSLQSQQSLWSGSDLNNGERDSVDDLLDADFDSDDDNESTRTQKGNGGGSLELVRNPTAMSPLVWSRESGGKADLAMTTPSSAAMKEERLSSGGSLFVSGNGESAPTDELESESAKTGSVHQQPLKEAISTSDGMVVKRAAVKRKSDTSSGPAVEATPTRVSAVIQHIPVDVGAGNARVAQQSAAGESQARRNKVESVSSGANSVSVDSAASQRRMLGSLAPAPVATAVIGACFEEIAILTEQPASAIVSNADGSGRSASGTYFGKRVAAEVAPSSGVGAAQGSEPKGRVAATAARFSARGRHRVSAGGTAGVAGRGALSGCEERAGSENRADPTEGLPFGSVRAKASAWGKTWRS